MAWQRRNVKDLKLLPRAIRLIATGEDKGLLTGLQRRILFYLDVDALDPVLPWMKDCVPPPADNLARFIFESMKHVLDEQDPILLKRLQKRFAINDVSAMYTA